VSKFTEFNAEKLHKLYKMAIKKREHEKKNKTSVRTLCALHFPAVCFKLCSATTMLQFYT